MPTVEVSLPDRMESELTRLVEQGEFLNRDQAVEELITMGISAYDTSDSSDENSFEDAFTQAVDDRQDPATQDDQMGDDYPY